MTQRELRFGGRTWGVLGALPLAMLPLLACSSSGIGTDESLAEAALGSGNYKVVTRINGKCLDVNRSGTADGTKIQEWTCNGSGAQSFRVEEQTPGVYRLVNIPSGKCVDVNGAGRSDGTIIHLWSCNGGVAQSFRTESQGGDYVRFVNPNSGKCIDIDGSKTADGTKVQLWTCNGTNAQAWKLVSLDPVVDGGGADTGNDSSVDSGSDTGPKPDAGVDSGVDSGPKPDAAVDSGPPDTGPVDPYATARQACVDYINQLRATVGLPALARWTANESCADGQCKSDSETGQAHGAFGQCPNFGQCECPNWGSIASITPGCLNAMWAEGPGGGHYDIMTSRSYTKVSCGFYVKPNGQVWAVQDYR
jgi:hypothetical protein